MASSKTIARRQIRERDLVAATRTLFDLKGAQDAPIEAIAKAVGIPRGLVYRHFSSKEELFVLTVTDYLEELDGVLRAAIGDEGAPSAKLERCVRAFADFGGRYPAFLDSALALMRRPARELNETVSDSVWFRLGQGMAQCLDQVARILLAGAEDRSFTVSDPDYAANVLWTQMLGAMHLARIGVGVRQLAPGIPGLFTISAEKLVETCVASAMATVGARGNA